MSAPDPRLKKQLAPFLLVAGLSAVVAGLLVLSTRWVLITYEDQLSLAELLFREDTIEMPVLVRTIGTGTVLAADDFEMVEIGAEYVPSQAISRIDEAVGLTVRERMLTGEYVRRERVAHAESGQGLSAIIPTGMRALSLNLRDGDVVSGFIDPGNSVDLLVTLPDDDLTDRVEETVTLLQTVKVLAVDEKISETANGEKVRKSSVTLTVNPESVEKVTHALAVGAPKLTLRAEIDVHHQEMNGAISADLLGRATDRMTVTEYRARVDDADLARMLEIIHADDKEEVAIDPRMLRGIE